MFYIFLQKLKLDVVNLTLILQAAGFDLHSFDYTSVNKVRSDDKLSIEIKCGKSGIISKLSKGSPRVCDCPESNESNNNSSFWVVEGVEPKSPLNNTNKVKTGSSNLLPQLSISDNVLTKNALGFLCEQYKQSNSNQKKVEINNS